MAANYEGLLASIDRACFQETYEYAVALKAATKLGRLELFKAQSTFKEPSKHGARKRARLWTRFRSSWRRSDPS